MSNQFLVTICLVVFIAGGVRSAALMMNMPQISKMEVQCTKNGMSVDVQFDLPFDGIIFSKGHFSDPACRYVGANSNLARFSFVVPMQGCGTNNEADAGSNLASNVIVIQNDAVVQEIWDSAQKLNCRWTDRVTKTVSVRPLTIDMLEAVDAKFINADDDEVDVWMDLQQGRWPTSKSIDSAVRIGEQLSLVVGISDPSAEMDLQVRDCYAHSTPELTDPSAFRVQLTDVQGCVMKTKLLGPFTKDRATTGPYAGSLVKWSSVSAFSFPDNMQVFTSCNVEICKGGCEPNPCQPESESNPSDGVLLPEADTTTARATTLPPVILFFPTVPPPRIQEPTFFPVTAAVTTVRITTARVTTPSYTTPNSPPSPAPTVERTQPPVTTPRYTSPAPTQPPVQNEILLPSLDYLPPSLDYLPPVSVAYKPAYNSVPTEAEPDCDFGSKDSRCFVPVQSKSTVPPKIIPPTTTLEPPPPPPSTVITTPYVCQPGSSDSRCSSSVAVSQATLAPDTYTTIKNLPEKIPSITIPPATIPPATAPPATIPPVKIAVTTIPSATSPPARIPTVTFLPITLPPTTTTTTTTTTTPWTTPTATPVIKKVTCYQGSGNAECLDQNPKGSQLPVSLCPPGSLDPECIFVPGGSNDSPVTSATTRPTSPPARPTTPPTRPTTSGRISPEKEVMESTKGESVDSWKGDPATHAFHMFHFQRGDGRRDRKNLQNKKLKRSAGDQEIVNGRAEFAQVRLTRSVRVLPAAMAVEPVSSSFEYLRQSEQSLKLTGRTYALTEQTFCVTTFSIAASAVLIITALLGLITIIVFLAIKYNTVSKRLAKLMPPRLYVALGSNRSKYSFVVPAKGCGTALADGTQSNILIFQSDPIVQEIWDMSRKVSCRFSDKTTKYVTWSPLTVEMLDVQSSSKTEEVDCWMDVMKGVYPATKPIDGNLKIGEELSLIIYLRDLYGLYDMAVRDCWAYDDGNIEVESTLKLQLTSTDGCAKKPKLMHFWRRTDQVGDSNATLVTYSNITAFRFPTKSEVYFTCNVDICEGSCNQRNCVEEESQISVVTKPPTTVTTLRPTTAVAVVVQTTTVVPIAETSTSRRPTEPSVEATTQLDCTTNPFDYRCPTTIRPPVSIPNCILKPEDPRCPQELTQRPCFPGASYPGCPPQITTSSPVVKPPIVCFPGSNDPRCPTTTNRPSVVTTLPPLPPPPSTTTGCYPGSPAPGCVTALIPTRAPCFIGSNEPECSTTTSTPEISQPTPTCFPGSNDPRCPSVIPVRTTTARPLCVPGSNVSGCPVTTSAPLPSTTTIRGVTNVPTCFPGSNNPECPTITTTTSAPTPYSPDCSPGTNNPKCPPITIAPTLTPLVCLPGTKDPRCPTTTQPPPPCLPGSDDPRCPTTITTTALPTASPTCFPGSRDPKCPTIEPEAPIPSSTSIPITAPTTSSFTCIPGSGDPRCPTVRTTTISPPSCFPGSSDPRCPTVATTTATTTTTRTPLCLPGSNDPSCPSPTSFTTTTSTTFPPFVCSPESNDPRCPTSATPTVPAQVCIPGSKDPRCPQPPPVCTPGSEDPGCPPIPFTKSPTTSTTTTSPPLVCNSGSTDPRCPTTTITIRTTSTTTQRTFVCIPGSTDPRCPTTAIATTEPSIICTPESKDPRCRTVPPRTTTTTTTTSTPTITTATTKKTPTITTTSATTPTPTITKITTQRQPICPPGSNDPGCPRPSTTTPSPTRCIPESNDPSCSSTVATTETPIRCIPGSNDPRCPLTAETTTRAPGCIPGSNDSRCPPVTSPATLPPPVCIEGSTDRRCPTSPSPPECAPNSNDPRCPAVSTTARTKTTTQTVIDVPVTSTTRKPSTAASVDDPGKPGWEGADPRYHAFHSWLYQPAPRPRGSKIKTSLKTASNI